MKRFDGKLCVASSPDWTRRVHLYNPKASRVHCDTTVFYKKLCRFKPAENTMIYSPGTLYNVIDYPEIDSGICAYSNDDFDLLSKKDVVFVINDDDNAVKVLCKFGIREVGAAWFRRWFETVII